MGLEEELGKWPEMEIEVEMKIEMMAARRSRGGSSLRAAASR